jgi:hypothetical protein
MAGLRSLLPAQFDDGARWCWHLELPAQQCEGACFAFGNQLPTTRAVDVVLDSENSGVVNVVGRIAACDVVVILEVSELVASPRQCLRAQWEL